MPIMKIPVSELEVMKVIWSNEIPISSKKIVDIVEKKKEWKVTTILTLLSRLVKKEFLSVTKNKKINYYMPIVTESEYLGVETRNFFKMIHRGSLKSFITTLHNNNDITDDDLDKLSKWIENR